jgi:hypothetical protein
MYYITRERFSFHVFAFYPPRQCSTVRELFLLHKRLIDRAVNAEAVKVVARLILRALLLLFE